MEALLHQIVQEEQLKMQQLGFVETFIPSQDSPTRCSIFMSANWHICRRLLLIIVSGNGIQPGIWSRSLVLEAPEVPNQYRTGSMYVSLAVSRVVARAGGSRSHLQSPGSHTSTRRCPRATA